MVRLRYPTCFLILNFINTINGAIIIIAKPESKPQNYPLNTNKVTLVKRIVPHNYKTPDFEYDRKLKTIFSPKYRIHHPKVHAKFHPFEPIKVRHPNLVAAILRIIGAQNGRYTKGDYLRNTMDEHIKAGEYDPDGHDVGRPDQVDDVVVLPENEFNFPHFSLYNTWTYDKAMLHDQCPPPLAVVGKRCVFAPWAR